MRGAIHPLRAPKKAAGHEQQGRRYCVVLQEDALELSTVLVAPTSASAQPSSFRVAIDLGGTETLVMLEQMGAVDAGSRLGELIGYVTTEEMQRIERALLQVAGLGWLWACHDRCERRAAPEPH
ncbi:MAG: type II toxin-antitoxin system PemK/MazF family toxin [Micrococcales bacterium]|nr:type II toxin-antitoxin system PemK/MazF family toxin [Micrococcales bacterium]